MDDKIRLDDFQYRIATLISDGQTSRQIAKMLGVTQPTIDNELYKIYKSQGWTHQGQPRLKLMTRWLRGLVIRK